MYLFTDAVSCWQDVHCFSIRLYRLCSSRLRSLLLHLLYCGVSKIFQLKGKNQSVQLFITGRCVSVSVFFLGKQMARWSDWVDYSAVLGQSLVQFLLYSVLLTLFLFSSLWPSSLVSPGCCFSCLPHSPAGVSSLLLSCFGAFMDKFASLDFLTSPAHHSMRLFLLYLRGLNRFTVFFQALFFRCDTTAEACIQSSI